MISSTLRHLVHAIRTLARRPGWTLHATLTLALGIGATTAVYTVARAVLFAPLPVANPDRVVVLVQGHAARGLAREPVTPGRYLDLRDRLRGVERAGALWLLNANLAAEGSAERAQVAVITASWLPTLGIRIVAGRGFTAADERSDAVPVALLSRSLWLRRFGGRPDVCGRQVVPDGAPYTIVGVVADDLVWPAAVDVWTPMAFTVWNRASRSLHVVARLAPGRSPAQVRQEIAALDATLASEHPQSDGGWRTEAVPLHERVSGRARQPLLLLLGAVALLLLIAGVNVANLLLALWAESEHELAIRAALGAGVGDLVGLLVARSVVVALAGAGAGVLIAWLVTRSVLPLAASFLPRAAEVAFDWRALLFALAVGVGSALVAGCVSGVATIRGARRRGLTQARGATSPARRRLRDLLVVAEMALTFALTVSAGLMTTSLGRLSRVEAGFRTESVLTARLSLPMRIERYRRDPLRARFWDALLEKAAGLPGVTQAGLVSSLPLGGTAIPFKFFTDDQVAGEPREAEYRAVSAGYFATLSIRCLAGRLFGETDGRDGRQVAVINEALARCLWPGTDKGASARTALARRLSVNGPKGPFLPIVGVVADVRHFGLDRPPTPEIYVPYPQEAWPQMTVVIRTAAAMPAVASGLRAALKDLDPALGAYDVKPFADVLGETTGMRRLVTVVLAAFSSAALLLASVGVSGMLAFMVAVRRREIGIRMALGASRATVVRLVAGHGARLAAVGIAAGVLIAVATGRWLQAQLFGVDALDPATFVLVAATLLAVAIAAAAAPSVRAARIEPNVTLRCE